MRTDLSSIRPGRSARIVELGNSGGLHRRLLDMGVTRGTVVDVARVAPLGDPMELRVKGYRLSLRKADAGMIAVEEC
jgi:Fe2+ transport system protein FeoA